MRILAVGAHPDDLEVLCGGTLAKYADKGHAVIMANLCSGSRGGTNIECEELARIRGEEAKAAAELIGAQALGAIAGDLDLYGTEQMRIKTVDLIREAKPDVIITHSPNDYMSDHVVTSQLVFDASFAAAVPLYETKLPAHEAIIPVFYMDTLAGVGFEPSDYVDITDYIQTKKQMFLCHQSQLQWIKGHHKTEPTDMLETVAKFRGFQCGVAYAEGFRKLNVWGRLRAERLLP